VRFNQGGFGLKLKSIVVKDGYGKKKADSAVPQPDVIFGKLGEKSLLQDRSPCFFFCAWWIKGILLVDRPRRHPMMLLALR
jgi:hypothetical protein